MENLSQHLVEFCEDSVLFWYFLPVLDFRVALLLEIISGLDAKEVPSSLCLWVDR